MNSINILEAKTNFVNLIESIEHGQEQEIIIARDGFPIAKIVPMKITSVEQRIGIARGKFDIPDDIDVHNKDVANLFYGNTQ